MVGSRSSLRRPRKLPGYPKLYRHTNHRHRRPYFLPATTISAPVWASVTCRERTSESSSWPTAGPAEWTHRSTGCSLTVRKVCGPTTLTFCSRTVIVDGLAKGGLYSDIFGLAYGVRYAHKSGRNGWPALSLYAKSPNANLGGCVLACRDEVQVTRNLSLGGELASNASYLAKGRLLAGRLSLYGYDRHCRRPRQRGWPFRLV